MRKKVIHSTFCWNQPFYPHVRQKIQWFRRIITSQSTGSFDKGGKKDNCGRGGLHSQILLDRTVTRATNMEKQTVTWANTRGRPHLTANILPVPDFPSLNEHSVTKGFFFSAEGRKKSEPRLSLTGMKAKPQNLKCFPLHVFRLYSVPECCSDQWLKQICQKGKENNTLARKKKSTKNSLVTLNSFTFSHWPVGDAEMTLSIQKNDHFVNKHRSNIKSSPQHTSRTKLLTLRCRLYSDRGSYTGTISGFLIFFLPPITTATHHCYLWITRGPRWGRGFLT